MQFAIQHGRSCTVPCDRIVQRGDLSDCVYKTCSQGWHVKMGIYIYVIVFTDLKDDFRSIMHTLEKLLSFALIHVRWLPSLISSLRLFQSAMYSFYLILFWFI